MPLKNLKPAFAATRQGRIAPAQKEAHPFYLSPEWQELRRSLIASRGRRCEQCGKTTEDDGSPVKLIGDHIQEIRDGGARLDPANIRLLCVKAGGDGRPDESGSRGGCHNRKTARARDARAMRGGF